LSSAWARALGKKNLCWVPSFVAFGKVFRKKLIFFAECLPGQHSANRPLTGRRRHGPRFFAECPDKRHSAKDLYRGKIHRSPLPSATLGKGFAKWYLALHSAKPQSPLVWLKMMSVNLTHAVDMQTVPASKIRDWLCGSWPCQPARWVETMFMIREPYVRVAGPITRNWV
jgi:hypothetical protein